MGPLPGVVIVTKYKHTQCNGTTSENHTAKVGSFMEEQLRILELLEVKIFYKDYRIWTQQFQVSWNINN